MNKNISFSLHTLELGPMENLIYLILDQSTGQAAVVDPGWEPEQILILARELNATITDVLLTHSHFDHVDGLEAIINSSNARLHLLKDEAQFWNKYLDIPYLHHEGEIIHLGQTPIKVLHTPGHTPGSACYLLPGHLFTGDTLFVLGHGRCDLPGGNSNEMYRTLHRLGTEIPGETVIHPGHYYGWASTSTITEQLASNPSMDFSDYSTTMH
ncbi:hydroxyacylglutathione hydrolase [Gammaproteobacteria bacterium]